MSKKQEQERLIRAKDFGGLFTGIGWDLPPTKNSSVELQLPNGSKFFVKAVCQKRGFVVCVCESDEGLTLKRAQQKRLTQKLGRYFYENLLIIHGKNADGKNAQRWMACIRPKSSSAHTATVDWHEGQGVEVLRQKISELGFSLDEEIQLGQADVVERVHAAFDKNREAVTRKFYAKFRNELKAFAEFISGLSDLVDKERYSSLMLNRLMFIYFIQKKGFLDKNQNYLQDHLKRVQKERGKNQFHKTFYRVFLRKLFYKGLDTPPEKRKEEDKRELGNVPYLNGGLFDIHQLEVENEKLNLPDAAFERLFAFFDRYSWHLDTRGNASGNDINPDVLGYIFEKYINDRAAMGAYYTQEDITGYIAQNTVLPFLLARAKEGCFNAFHQSGIWRFLRDEPDNFIYEAVKHGTDKPDSDIPPEIAVGIPTNKPDLQKRRAGWNAPAPADFALPTETWREVIARRRRCKDLRAKIKGDKIISVGAMVSNNINIARFMRSALYEYEGADFVSAVFRALAGVKATWCEGTNEKPRRGISVLDPACGSGAFLFAALNILKPVYELCVERMRQFVEEDDRRLAKPAAKKGKQGHLLFRAVLKEIGEHPNEDYWIYKTIILENLYGVDLMEDAAEVAKLRLFLKLAAVAEIDENKPNLGLEPLPDIDYNIRSGNSLVGYASMAEFDGIHKKRLRLSEKKMQEVQDKAEEVRIRDRAFRAAQDKSGDEHIAAKKELREELNSLNEKLSEYLGLIYGKDKTKNPAEFCAWEKSHRPFHWAADFYDIMEGGGFDVVIGNPPYVEYEKVRAKYEVIGFRSSANANLYFYFMEQANVLSRSENSYTGMIVPISLPSTARAESARNIYANVYSNLHVSFFADRPSALFTGVHQKLTIFIASRSKTFSPNVQTTGYVHWNKAERTFLFENLHYFHAEYDGFFDGVWNKDNFPCEKSIRGKLLSAKQSLAYIMYPDGPKSTGRGEVFYVNHRLMHWVKTSLHAQKSKEFKAWRVADQITAAACMAVLNSNLFFWAWETTGDGWHLLRKEIDNFNINLSCIKQDVKILSQLGEELNADLEKNKVYVGTVQTDYEYKHSMSKHIIDQIDNVLAKHYGFTDEELDYIINYGYKYRVSS